jgi:bla regulator protein blaR1
MIEQWMNHLWQSSMFAVLTALIALSFRKNRAHVRYWLWLIASVKFLVPFALLINLGNRLWEAFATKEIATKLAPPDISLKVQYIAQPFAGSPVLPSAPLSHSAEWISVAILSLWFCGFLSIVLIRFRGWLRIRSAMGASSPIEIHGQTAVRSSSELLEPGVVGLFRPTLLLPEGILRHLSPPQLEAVVAHELCHIRRHDNLTAAIHMVVEALFWFHPFVWWIGARLVEERERACDEAVLCRGSEPRNYADAIVSVCKLYVESPLNCVSGISGADLKKRIVRIMASDVGLNMGPGKKLLLSAAGMLALALPVVVGWGQVQSAKLMLVHPRDGAKHAFEVATIKPSPESSHVRIAMSPANFSATGMSVIDMIKFAYGIKSDEQIVDGPGWLKTEHFDIQGKGSEADIAAYRKLGFEKGMDVPRLLVQSLLEERFQLKVRIETRDLPAYALVVDKRGIKMKEVTPDPFPPPGERPHPGAHLPMFARTGPNEITATAWGMPQFAETLSSYPDVGKRPVVDETGLTGHYDFVLSGVAIASPFGDSVMGAQTADVSIFSALSEQLGLKLVPVKAPVEILVIDRVEKPSPN